MLLPAQHIAESSQCEAVGGISLTEQPEHQDAGDGHHDP